MAKAKTEAASRAKKFRILSIDGGGIRGIIPGQILVKVEKLIQETTGEKDARIADYFDLIAGTSTGGILTCVYLAPAPGTSRPQYTAEDAVRFYLDRGDEVFDLSLWQRVRSVGGLRDEKYAADGLEEALDDHFKEMKVSELLRPCLVTAYDIQRRRAHFFTQHDAKTNDAWDFLVKDVCRATSAAPTFFEAARVKSMTQVPYALIDGGLFANNPTLCAYAEARSKVQFKNRIAKEMLILSLGTGGVKRQYPYKLAKDWGALEWIVPVLDIMMSGVAETVDYQLGMMFDAVNAQDQYLRINPDLGEADNDMDDASQANLNALRDAGQEAAEKHESELRDFVAKICA